ncbi:MAG TPA: DegT/DnrJ/EryC1/StrS family aminotransferase [Solirubrobacteraceae bacterium]|nr:DegT/DnrJ/EryC1/StrS family aminotransferase [Solirubrobacteraceae bacterium]
MTTASERGRRLALLGGTPTFSDPVPLGQLGFPSWERFEAAIRGICERGWYTNHGPLAVEAERRLADELGVAEVVCVSNATVGLMMACRALGLAGSAVVSTFTPPAAAEALLWSGVTPRLCDVEAGGVHADPETVRAAIDDDVCAIVAVNLWGGFADLDGLTALAAERRVPLVLDSAHAFGSAYRGAARGALEVFSFHESHIVNTGEGGCVATDDPELAARLRNIRSSYGAGRPVPVPITSNGRFSEAQAALALLALDDLESARRRNREQFDRYAAALAGVDGLRLVEPARARESNHQSAVVEVDDATFGLSAPQLVRVLRAEGVEAAAPIRRPLHRTTLFRDAAAGPLPRAERAAASLVQLPLGAALSAATAEEIAELIVAAGRSAATLAAAL